MMIATLISMSTLQKASVAKSPVKPAGKAPLAALRNPILRRSSGIATVAMDNKGINFPMSPFISLPRRAEGLVDAEYSVVNRRNYGADTTVYAQRIVVVTKSRKYLTLDNYT